MMSDWCIGLSSWIIQDGNYGDLHRHQQLEFAVEFHLQTWCFSSLEAKRARQLSPSEYEVNAAVVRAMDAVWVIDFGFPTYRQCRPPEGLRQGTWIEAVVNLGVDPFFYLEDLAHDDGIPPLIYTWMICNIRFETAPFIEIKDAFGRSMLVRDETQSAYREIEKTNAWCDDDGHAEYVLDCALLDHPPKRTRSA